MGLDARVWRPARQPIWRSALHMEDWMATATLTAAAPYLILQDYAAYTEEQHSVWGELVGRVMPGIERHAAREYLKGFEIIGLQRGRLPNLAEISRRLGPRTGWSSTPVSGFLPGP